jgi:membrane protease YdiL (CAAX protease family)
MTEPINESGFPTPSPASAEPGPTGHVPVASYIHTAIVVIIMLAVGYASAVNSDKFKPGAAVSTYITTIVFQWILFAVVLLGVKLRKFSLNDILGRPWKSFDDFLMDIVVAAGFWLSYVVIIGVATYFLNHGAPTNVKEAMKGVEGLAPRTLNQFLLWIALSSTAGFVEEFVFRGYLQRQFTALTQRVWLGVLIPSAIFLCGHLYQGEKAIMTGVLGIFFGILAAWRRNLRPGIIAHVWQDTLAGAVMFFLTQHPGLVK